MFSPLSATRLNSLVSTTTNNNNNALHRLNGDETEQDQLHSNDCCCTMQQSFSVSSSDEDEDGDELVPLSGHEDNVTHKKTPHSPRVPKTVLSSPRSADDPLLSITSKSDGLSSEGSFKSSTATSAGNSGRFSPPTIAEEPITIFVNVTQEEVARSAPHNCWQLYHGDICCGTPLSGGCDHRHDGQSASHRPQCTVQHNLLHLLQQQRNQFISHGSRQGACGSPRHRGRSGGFASISVTHTLPQYVMNKFATQDTNVTTVLTSSVAMLVASGGVNGLSESYHLGFGEVAKAACVQPNFPPHPLRRIRHMKRQ